MRNNVFQQNDQMATTKRHVAKGEAARRIVLAGAYRKQPKQLPWMARHHLFDCPLSEKEAENEDRGSLGYIPGYRHEQMDSLVGSARLWMKGGR